MADLLKKWASYANKPADIKSKPNGSTGLKCSNCGNDDINEFMKPMGYSLVCLKCNKTIQ